MKKTIVTFVFYVACLFFLVPVCAQKQFDMDDFREFVNKEMKNWNVPGIAIMILKDENILLSEGFGYRNVEEKLNVTPDTIFAVGSDSKAFTVLALGMLVDEKKLHFDQPVRDYLPTFRMYDDYLTEHLTPRDMLTHRSGLPRHDLVWYGAGLTSEETTERLRYLQLSYGLREHFQYNNLMYQALGCLVCMLSGRSWEEFVTKRIFTPLGMKNSNFSIEELQKYPDHAFPYSMDIKRVKKFPEKLSDIEFKRIPFFKMTANGPAGSINSNLKDMTKWVRFHLAEGKVSGNRIIARETLSQMHASQMVIPSDSPFKFLIHDETPTISYGLGWFIEPYRGHYMINHGGNVPGFTSLVSFMPKEKIGIVVLTNMNGTLLPYIITFNIFDRLLGLKQVDWSERLLAEERDEWEKMKAEEAKAEKQQQKNTKPSHSLADYIGRYKHPAYGEIIIGKEGKRLNIKFRDRTAPIEHYHYDTFRISDEDPDHLLVYFDVRNVTFLLDKNGNIDKLALPLQAGVDDLVFKKEG